MIAGLAWVWWSKPLDVEYAYSSEIPLFEAGIATLASFGNFYLSAILLLFVLINFFNRLEGALISCLAIIPFWLIVWLDGFRGYFYNPRQVLFCLPFFLLASVGGINYYLRKLIARFHLNQESVLIQHIMPAVNGILVMISWFANWSWLKEYYINGPGYK